MSSGRRISGRRISGRRLAWGTLVSGSASAIVLLAACSSSPMSVAVSPEGGGTPVVPGSEGGPVTDAGTDTTVATTDAPATSCDGACKTTSLAADFGGRKRTLVRAQFGTQQGDAGTELHTESHLGGDPACPTMSSPSPDYTLIVTAIPRGAVGQKLSQNDGIKAVFFDFKADLGLAAPSGLSKSLSVNVTVVAEDPATPPAWVAVDVTAGFTEGTVAGHLYAEYCQSLTQ